MKNKLILLVTMSFMFLTGCTIKYDLVIDSNLKVKETISIKEDNSILNVNNKNLEAVPKMFFAQYKSMEDYKSYELIDEIHTDNETGAIIESKFSTFEQYKKSMPYAFLFSKVTVTEAYNYVSVAYTDFNHGFFTNAIDPNKGDVNDIEVNIRFHNKVTEHNAESCNDVTNTCTWRLGKDASTQMVSFTIDTDSKRYDIIFKDFITNNLVTLIIIGSLALIGIVAYFSVINKTRSSNKI